MQEQLDKIETKVDKILEIQSEMKVVQAEQHVTLQEHMKRSDANEKAVTILADEIKGPINSKIVKYELILKVVTWVLGLAISAAVGGHFIHF